MASRTILIGIHIDTRKKIYLFYDTVPQAHLSTYGAARNMELRRAWQFLAWSVCQLPSDTPVIRSLHSSRGSERLHKFDAIVHKIAPKTKRPVRRGLLCYILSSSKVNGSLEALYRWRGLERSDTVFFISTRWKYVVSFILDERNLWNPFFRQS